jgi:diguanylate cyclase (GGDEF)-like protein
MLKGIGVIIILEDKFLEQEIAESKHVNAVSKIHWKSNMIVRCVIFTFSVALCVLSEEFLTRKYAILESLAVIFIYSIVVTFLSRNTGKMFLCIKYMDVLLMMALIYLTGGVNSELYILLFLFINFCILRDEVSENIKLISITMIIYALVCILSNGYEYGSILYIKIFIREVILVMNALCITYAKREVKKYDEMRKREFRIARTDKLTGLANRHYFDQKLKEEVEYADESNSVLNILMFDLDNFKSFNDTYGHVSGDKLLALFSDIIRQSIRNVDIPVRYGGEEFIILIRDLDIVIAKSVGDRVRRQLEKQRIYVGQVDERHRITVSCGAAQYPTHSKNIREVIEKADQALYRAKELGKNIVVTYDDIGKSREMIENNF